FVEAEKLPKGPSQLYFVLLPHKVVTCLEAGVCSNNFYCAYHSYIAPGTANEIIYADIPFSLLDSEWVKGCQADGNGEIQLPNGDATLTNSTRYADVALKYISHEYTEAVTDPLVGFDTAWVDREELENGDKCNAVPFSSAEEGAPGVDNHAFTPTLGGSASAGTLYNQEIDAGHFYLQSEWDNAGKACLMKPLALKSAQFTHSPATPAAGTPVSFSASVTDPYGHPVYSWSFGDGGAAGSGAAPTHTYEAGGKYTVKLTIEDARTNSKATVEAELVIAGPLVVTGTATSLTQGSATLRGTVNPLGKAVSKCEFEYGTSVPYGAKAPCASLPPTSEEPQPVSASLSTLSANTTYHFRLVAVTEAGTSKGADQTFKTLPEPPVVVTGATPSPLGQESATLNGTVNPKGVAVSKCEFEYGEAGQVAQHRVPCSALPGAAETPVAVSGAISALTPGTEYELRLVAETSGGKVTAEPHAFQTLPKLSPLVLVSKPSPVGQSSATLLGSVDPRGGAVLECRFDYGASADYGSSAPCSPAPGGGTGAVAVAGALSGLAPGGTYHFRLVATNSGGTAETGDQTFTTASAAPPLLAPTFPSQILGSVPLPPTASSALSTASSAFSLSGPVINASTGVATFTLSVVNGGTASWLLTFQNGKFGVFAASAHKCKAGSAWLGGRCRPAKVVFAKAGRTVVAAGSVTITIKPGAAALKALKNALRKKKGLTVSAQITFRSSLGAAAVAHSVTFTDRLKKR
ncbi:MAG: hypothetical protein QOI03_977, partial [Solirubrobacteraceae bacterium]|nr:hypothetical protein [Solirubrobacteraceae bacterium]